MKRSVASAQLQATVQHCPVAADVHDSAVSAVAPELRWRSSAGPLIRILPLISGEGQQAHMENREPCDGAEGGMCHRASLVQCKPSLSPSRRLPP